MRKNEEYLQSFVRDIVEKELIELKGKGQAQLINWRMILRGSSAFYSFTL